MAYKKLYCQIGVTTILLIVVVSFAYYFSFPVEADFNNLEYKGISNKFQNKII